jgi:ADP-heptose:LPS heptosyltransferase
VESVLACLPPGSRVAILRLRSLGDCVLTTPALGILKRFRPDLRVAVAVEDGFRAIFEDHPDIDELLPPEIGAVRRFRPALCLNLHGGTRSAWMTALSGAKWRAGFGHFRHELVYNVRIPRAQEILGVERKVHTAEHLASAMFYLGAPMGEVGRAKLQSAQAGRPVPLAVIHPMAANPAKTWPAANFLAVADHLQASGIEPVFIGAAADDLSAFARFRTIQGAPLAEIKSLLSTASLFVGNDSGPAHMAAAFGVPVVVIFSASDPDIWGPWRTAGEIVRAPASTEQVLEALARLRVHA